MSRHIDETRYITKCVHKPTFCYLTEYNAETGRPRARNKHTLDSFKIKNEVQSNQSISRLKNAVNWLILFAEQKRIFSKTPFWNKKTERWQQHFKFRIAFITLTLSDEQRHPDKYIKEHLLQPFLYWMTRYYRASYVWKAETQLNGNIHFHITIDTFIHWRSIRAKWNQLLAAHGYCKVFQDGTNDKGNSSTQVKAARDEKGIAKYLAGYIGKKNEYNADKYKKSKPFKKLPVFSFPEITLQAAADRKHYYRFVSGRLWGCSESLSNIHCFTEELDHHFREEEKIFFRSNELKRLSTVILADGKERTPRQEDKIKMQFGNIFIHRNLKFCKLPALLQHRLAEEKSKRNFNPQINFTVDNIN